MRTKASGVIRRGIVLRSSNVRAAGFRHCTVLQRRTHVGARPRVDHRTDVPGDRNHLLPQGIDADRRAKEIVPAAYAGARLAAVSTAAIEQVQFLRCKMAVYRCAIAPDFRGKMMSMLITAHSLKALEAWSLAHPDEGVMGMLAVLENETYKKKTHPHRAPETKLSLVAFNPQGREIVVAWFDHARL
jgi:hypothetical protein